MNERIKRFSIGAAIFFLSLAVPFETNFSQEQSQLIKPCMANTTPEKKEDTTTAKKKGRKRQKTKDRKKDRNAQQQAKGSTCN